MATKDMRMASEVHALQNKILHGAFSMAGMPYNSNKDTWLSLMTEIAGRKCKSMNDLTLGERSELIEHMGTRVTDELFNPYLSNRVRGWQKGDPDVELAFVKRPLEVPPEKKALVSKIHAVLADMKLSWAYADGIAKKRYGVDRVEWCEREDIHTIVKMLVYHQRRGE